jgi:hypothetical protein
VSWQPRKGVGLVSKVALGTPAWTVVHGSRGEASYCLTRNAWCRRVSHVSSGKEVVLRGVAGSLGAGNIGAPSCVVSSRPSLSRQYWRLEGWKVWQGAATHVPACQLRTGQCRARRIQETVVLVRQPRWIGAWIGKEGPAWQPTSVKAMLCKELLGSRCASRQCQERQVQDRSR